MNLQSLIRMDTNQQLPNIITDKATGQRINLLDWKAANVRSSYVLGFFVFVFFGLIGYLLSVAIDPSAAIMFVAIALGVAAFQNIVGFWFSDQIALAASGARPANKEENRYLVNITEAVAIGAGAPTPKIYVIDSSAPNAFATGRNPKNGTIAVSTGLLHMLDRQELEGVIAHEMAHIKNFDILFMTMLAATVGAIIVLRDLITHGWRYSSLGRSERRSDRDSGGGQAQAIAYLLLIVLLILAPILTTLLRLAVSRKREYLADATGAYITRNPEGLARALEKLRDYSGQKLDVSEGVQHMFFTNPVKNLNANAMFATHPPIQERIDRLRRM
ncbi:MAG: M48 family metallopeptidase [Trueperaceae bacterium]